PEPLARTALPAAEPEFVRHVIADGDTLESIARRYLGDPARAGELFELNRDRLDDPQLLPIGMVVLAPRRTTTQTAVTQFRVPQRAPASATAIAQPVAYPRAATEATTQRDRLRHFGGPSDETVTPARPSPPAVWDRDANWDATGW
ncbi:MAG: LysM peptidoglycan-binding domain-containing protein, partial [Planctomycetota bacterium]